MAYLCHWWKPHKFHSSLYLLVYIYIYSNTGVLTGGMLKNGEEINSISNTVRLERQEHLGEHRNIFPGKDK